MLNRIALLAYALDRNNGGIGSYTSSLVTSLRQAGIDPMLLKAGRIRKGESGFDLPGASRIPGLLTIGQIAIARLVHRHDIQLLHDPTGICPLYFARCRKVVTIHDVLPLVTPRTSSPLERLLYRFWLPIILSQVDAVLTVSNYSRRDILRFFPCLEKKVFVTSIAVSRDFQPLDEDQVNRVLHRRGLVYPYILHVGSLNQRKNLSRLMMAFSHLCQTMSGWHLVITGIVSQKKMELVSEAIKRLGLADKVHFIGYVPQEELPAIYNGASFLCFPSLYEGFGLPPLEAMACGTPVITSNLSSLPEVTGDAALLVDPYDVGQIAAAMHNILSEPDLARDLRRRGLERASQFTLESLAQATLDIYQHVLES